MTVSSIVAIAALAMVILLFVFVRSLRMPRSFYDRQKEREAIRRRLTEMECENPADLVEKQSGELKEH